MTGTFETPWKMYNLTEHPEVAQEYGMYMASFSIMESMVYILFSRLLGSKEPSFANAQAILGHIQSLSLKLTTAENYLKHSLLDEQTLSDAADAIGIVRECNKFRNCLAHGMFALSAGELHLAPYAFETTRPTKPAPIDAETIRNRRILDVDRGIIILNCLARSEPVPDGLLRQPSLIPKKTNGPRSR